MYAQTITFQTQDREDGTVTTRATRNMDAISNAFIEINTKKTGFITLEEFDTAFERHKIKVYGGLSSLFMTISKGKDTISLADFSSAFSSAVYSHRTAAPTTKDILEQAHFLRFQLCFIIVLLLLLLFEYRYELEKTETGEEEVPPKKTYVLCEEDLAILVFVILYTYTYMYMYMYVYVIYMCVCVYREIDSMNYDAKTHRSNPGDQDNILEDDENDNELVSPHLYNHSSGNRASDVPKALMSDLAKMKNTNSGPSDQDPMSSLRQDGDTGRSSNNADLQMAIDKVISDVGLEIDLLSSPKSPHTAVRLTAYEAWQRIYKCYIDELWRMAWPACLMLIPLHIIQSIRDTFFYTIPVLTWYGFGVFLYLALQSTMIGYRITAKLFWLSIGISAGFAGLYVVLSHIVKHKGANILLAMPGGFLWIMIVISEIVGRMWFIRQVAKERSKRGYFEYALSRALGVSMFWLVQTFIQMALATVEFTNPWAMFGYIIVALMVIRGLLVIFFGTNFVDHLSDHFYFEDGDRLDLKTHQMIVTQLSLMATYPCLFALYRRNFVDSVFMWPIYAGFTVYQLLLLCLDYITKRPKIRGRQVSVFRGELLAWLAIGIKAIMSSLYHTNKKGKPQSFRYYDNKSIERSASMVGSWIWGLVLIFFCAFVRFYRIWTYSQIDDYSAEIIPSQTHTYYVRIICLMTIGYIVSVTEVAEAWTNEL
ncbi:hypothetical protein RFI_18758 [Reticulomyxa filosa]|uniref:EF-hand domain-containing protein n=1 Tax=Reticulomyxa filosa TaxID=46433 RepID=X6MYF6_RETFI|nr:hypothetical protein RFI_18758 [Reticulomyxa filosa]|eukprot:ETO18507.1 hypothetical protein RFI_18758 [Reticulomyxa filosa]